jgi:glycosyltransferase involved in cell wall biosynthesis
MLVSAIMPTRSRPALSQTALSCFLQQTYTPRELIILDDEDDPSFPDSLPYELNAGWGFSVRYCRHKDRLSIGAKRELCCQMALGDVIIHFDSDDWSDPNRMQEQTDLLLSSGKVMTGYHSLLFWDMRNALGYFWKGNPGFACGTSMCYTREFWESHRWPDMRRPGGPITGPASDNEQVKAANTVGGISTVDGRGMCIARAHGNNSSSAQRIGQNAWPLIAAKEFPPLFFEALQQEAEASKRCA